MIARRAGTYDQMREAVAFYFLLEEFLSRTGAEESILLNDQLNILIIIELRQIDEDPVKINLI